MTVLSQRVPCDSGHGLSGTGALSIILCRCFRATKEFHVFHLKARAVVFACWFSAYHIPPVEEGVGLKIQSTNMVVHGGVAFMTEDSIFVS